MQPAVDVRHVTKVYRLNGRSGSFRQALVRRGRQFLGLERKRESDSFIALDDVSFRVGQGTSVGIVGPNGAGKTTILKLISGVSLPTRGQVISRGRVAALLELGAGFHPELSGRENVYLKAAILGLSVRETRQIFDRIVEFSGLEDFLEVPVKRYSSGMYVRLAFSVISHVEHEILLVDEVLAVGDARFRRKCARRITELLNRGTTLVLVSHDLHLVGNMCAESVFLAGGRVHFRGATAACISSYQAWQQQVDSERVEQPRTLESDVGRVTRVEVSSPASREPATFSHSDPVTIVSHLFLREPLSRARLAVRFVRSDGLVAAVIRTDDYGHELSLGVGQSLVVMEFAQLQLATGEFSVEVRLFGTIDGLPVARGVSEKFRVKGIHPVWNEESGFFVPDLGSVAVQEREPSGSRQYGQSS